MDRRAQGARAGKKKKKKKKLRLVHCEKTIIVLHDDAVELDEKKGEERDARRLLELVRAILLEPLLRLSLRKAVLDMAAHLGNHVFDRLFMDLDRSVHAGIIGGEDRASALVHMSHTVLWKCPRQKEVRFFLRRRNVGPIEGG